MGTEHLLRNKQGRLAEASVVDENTDFAVSLLEENALRGDEPSLWGDEQSDDMHSLLEENARLRRLFGSGVGPHPQKRRSLKVTPYHGSTA